MSSWIRIVTVMCVAAWGLGPSAATVEGAEKVLIIRDGSVEAYALGEGAKLDPKEDGRQKFNASIKSVLVKKVTGLPGGSEACYAGQGDTFESFHELTILVQGADGQIYQIEAKNRGFLFKKLNLTLFGNIEFKPTSGKYVLENFTIRDVLVRRSSAGQGRVVARDASRTDEKFCIVFSSRPPNSVGLARGGQKPAQAPTPKGVASRR